MSLIEATELATQNVQGRDHEPSLQDSPMVNPSVLDIEEDEEDRIRTGTSLAISDCGTYAVSAKDGLEIFPNKPESLVQQSEEDVDTLVRFHHEGGEDVQRKEAPPGRLSWGDRIQIVSIQNGWAKMARGYGYVRAGGHRLVKGKSLLAVRWFICFILRGWFAVFEETIESLTHVCFDFLFDRSWRIGGSFLQTRSHAAINVSAKERTSRGTKENRQPIHCIYE